MSEFITQTARLVPYAKRPKQAPGYVTAYLYEPLPNELGAQLGCLYVVIEALVSGRASEELADLIIETAGDRYYNQPVSDNENFESRFEGAVKAVNTELGEHVNRGNAAWIGKLSAVIAVQAGQDLHVSHTGSAEAYLYRGKSASQITTGEAKRPANPTKTFGSIATGKIEAGDHLLLATPALTHQVSLKRLQDIISGNSPNSAISELHHLLDKNSTDRIACLVIEVTTPELAALKVRSESPNEIRLGSPETPIEAAKMAATPLARTTAESGKKVATEVNKTFVRGRRRAHSLSLELADRIRQLLSSRRGRRTAGIVLAFIVILVILLVLHGRAHGRDASIFNNYQTSYNNFTQAQKQLSAGNSSEAQTTANTAQQQYTNLKPSETMIDQQLSSSTKLPRNEPRSYSAFGLQLTNFLQQVSGYTQVKPTTVASFSPSVVPTFMEVAGGWAYVVDTGGNKIYTVNLQTNSISGSITINGIGVVKATTLSPNNNGMYLLTNTPAVWFYNFQTNALTKQTIAYDNWPNSSAIGAYLSNLYLLSGNEVYKYVKNQTGFSPGVAYLQTGQPSSKTNPSALAVDGSIYVVVGKNLQRFSGGSLLNSAPIPANLPNLINLSSASDATVLIGSAANTNYLGVWKASASTLSLNKDIEVAGVKNLYDTTYDPPSSSIYATADHRLVRFNFAP